ncbi:MAG: C25 family cysteine peptidase [Fibrobacteria bacterium]
MTGKGRRIGSWLQASLWCVAACIPSAAKTPLAKVAEDVPGRLVLEVAAPDPLLRQDVSGIAVSCRGCHLPGRPGAPDLPVYRFDVISGPNAPAVTFRILESETRTVPEGILSVPFTPTPTSQEFRPDAKAYQEAALLKVRSFPIRTLRGVPVRGMEVPLALWSEASKTLTLIKRMQVELDFSGMAARPSPPLQGGYRKEVLNPVGGAYLYAPAASARVSVKARALAKTGAGKSANSVLGSSYIKIKIGDRSVENFREDGMYAIPFSALAKAASAGTLNGVKLRNLRLFTGINDTLRRGMDSADPLPGTLREIPIQVVDKNENGTFDDAGAAGGEDSIHFFAHGSSIWKHLPDAPTRIQYEFSADPYSFENNYYLDFSDGQDDGLRLADPGSPAATGSPLAKSYSYLRAEKDLAAAACDPSHHKDEETGFDFFWHWKGSCEPFHSDTTVTLSRSDLHSDETDTLRALSLDDPGDTLFLGFYTYYSRSDSLFRVQYGGNGDTLELYRNTGSPGTWYAWGGHPLVSPALRLDALEWAGSEKRFEGYSVCYPRKHVFTGEPLWIFPPETGKTVSYQVQGGAGAVCLRIEDGVATRFVSVNGQGVFTDSLAKNADAKYYLFRNTAPLPAGALDMGSLPAKGTALRNLATGDSTRPEYLIITARPLLEQALSLRDYRRDSKRVNPQATEVVLVEDIYRQFSSGRLSVPAIRDFIRYAYYGWDNKRAAGALKSVLLFGDGHYDYRNITTTSPPPNHIPPFEFIVPSGVWEEVASDDFYGMMEPGEFGYAGGPMSLAVGRIPVQTTEEAANYLRKVRAFEDPALAGEWRGRVVLAADDNIQRGQPNDIDPIHQGHTTDTDLMGKGMTANEKGLTVDKVYLLDYPMNSAFHKPEAAQDLLGLINRGTLMVNYVGHGASNQWADEMLLQTNDALSRMHNEGRTPMVNAFSCTVGRFETIRSEGMSEQFVKHKDVGAIAAISATRESYPDPNVALANAFYDRALPPDSSTGFTTVGEALRQAKNASETNSEPLNDLKYNLMGEPVLLLRKPQLQVALTEVMDTIKALDCSTIKGRITGGKGSGKVNIKIVAGFVHKVYKSAGTVPQIVDKRGNVLFERTFAYKNWEFATEYFIPKQISFGDSTAQVQVFAWDDSLEMEGSNAVQNLRIEGTAQSACASNSDGKGPTIRITGCETKETAELDFPDHVRLSLPYCLRIYVQDSLGGVLSAEGPDEGTTLEIPGTLDPFHPQPGIDDLYRKSYQISLDKKAIRPGQHLLKVSARDGYGNIGQRQLQMDLTLDSSITAVTAYNFPNPMKRNGTTFHFATVLPTQNLEFGDPNAGKERLEYEIKVYNQNGNLVRVFPSAISGQTSWDGRDNWGNLLANGVYFYKITARQLLTDDLAKPDYGTVSSKRNILVISR